MFLVYGKRTPKNQGCAAAAGGERMLLPCGYIRKECSWDRSVENSFFPILSGIGAGCGGVMVGSFWGGVLKQTAVLGGRAISRGGGLYRLSCDKQAGSG